MYTTLERIMTEREREEGDEGDERNRETEGQRGGTLSITDRSRSGGSGLKGSKASLETFAKLLHELPFASCIQKVSPVLIDKPFKGILLAGVRCVGGFFQSSCN